MTEENKTNQDHARPHRKRRRKHRWRRFAVELLLSRQLNRLIRGLPSLVIAIAVAILFWIGTRTNSATLTIRYLDAAKTALDQDDVKAADVFLRTVVDDSGGDCRRLYELAVASLKQRDDELARRLMARIAPVGALGYGPAHLWLAKDLLRRKRQLSGEDVAVLESHLRHAIAGKQHFEARVLLARLYASTQRLPDAVELMETVVEAKPEAHVELARWNARLDDLDAAKHHARQATEYCQLRLAVDPQDIDVRLLLAESQLLLGDAAKAFGILREGLANSRDQRLRDALVQLHVLLSDAVRKRDETKLEAAIQILEKALAIDPGHALVLERLSSLCAQREPDRERVRAILQQSLAYGHESAAAHFILGTIASVDEDYDTAVRQLEKSLELRPEMAAAMNNLAWCLAHGPEPDLNRALKLVDQALAIAPDRAQYLETRGQIRAKLGDWNDAIVDLERALPGIPDCVQLHQTLALAYEKTGEAEKARAHRSRVQSMLDKQ
jgi:tetratricopeptide (TPR) repeat protein